MTNAKRGTHSEVSPEQKSRDRRNKYLLKKFSITLDQKDAMSREQGGLCPTCGGHLDAHGPSNTDHYHAHLEVQRSGLGGWDAWAIDESGAARFPQHAKTKAAVMRALRAAIMPWAIRALLCAKCNKALGYIERFFDAARHPENLDRVKNYFVCRLQKIIGGY